MTLKLYDRAVRGPDAIERAQDQLAKSLSISIKLLLLLDGNHGMPARVFAFLAHQTEWSYPPQVQTSPEVLSGL